MPARYDWKDYEGRIPIAFLSCQRQAERLRKALGLVDARVTAFLLRQGIQFALCGERHTPSRTLTAWYPRAHDEWARRHFGTTYDEAWGWYDEDERTIVATKRPTVVTVVHEIGHAVDMLTGGLSDHFYRPGCGVTAYAETDAREFWAEAFEQWFCPWGDRDLVARAHPHFPHLFSALGRVLSENADLRQRLS